MLSHWPSLWTAFGSLNVNGWLRRPRESRRSEPRRASVPRLVKKHNIDLLGLQETHLHDQGVMDAQSWWLRKNGFAAHFNLQLDQSDKEHTSISSWTSPIKAPQALFGGSPNGSMCRRWPRANGF